MGGWKNEVDAIRLEARKDLFSANSSASIDEAVWKLFELVKRLNSRGLFLPSLQTFVASGLPISNFVSPHITPSGFQSIMPQTMK